MNNFFPQNLKYLREEAGLTQEELADKLNVKRSAYAHWENGTREPNMGMVVKISDYFGVGQKIITQNLKIYKYDETSLPKNISDYPNAKIVHTIPNTGFNISYVPIDGKEWEDLTIEEQQKHIADIIDELYEHKLSLKDKK